MCAKDRCPLLVDSVVIDNAIRRYEQIALVANFNDVTTSRKLNQ
jgi:hypothetical protein